MLGKKKQIKKCFIFSLLLGDIGEKVRKGLSILKHYFLLGA